MNPVWVDEQAFEGLTEITDWDQDELEDLNAQNYTVLTKWVVEYTDATAVEVPEAEYLDSIRAEHKFKKPWSVINEFEETTSWLFWLRLKRHPVEEVRPKVRYEDWVKTIDRLSLRAWYDPEEDVAPLAAKMRRR